MGGMSIWHWLVLLAIVLLVFGTKKIGNLGGDLGKTIRDFKKGLRDDDEEDSADGSGPQLRADDTQEANSEQRSTHETREGK